MRARLDLSQSCSSLRPGGLLEVADHLVDRVLEVADLAGGVDGDRPGEVALGHGGGHLGDGPHLGGEVAGQLVHALGEPLPRAGHALDLGLAAELALGAHLPGHPGDLGGERCRAGRPWC